MSPQKSRLGLMINYNKKLGNTELEEHIVRSDYLILLQILLIEIYLLTQNSVHITYCNNTTQINDYIPLILFLLTCKILN